MHCKQKTDWSLSEFRVNCEALSLRISNVYLVSVRCSISLHYSALPESLKSFLKIHSKKNIVCLYLLDSILKNVGLD